MRSINVSAAIAAIICLVLFSGCHQIRARKASAFVPVAKHSGKVCSLSSIEYVKKFPLDISPKRVPLTANYDLIGARDLLVQDSIMFISYNRPNTMISAFDITGGNELGSFLNKGNGPSEVLSLANLDYVQNLNNRLMISVPDGKNKILEIDMLNSITLGYPDVPRTIDISADGFVMHAMPIPKRNMVYCTTLNDNMSGIRRFFTDGEEESSIPAMDKLNESHLDIANDSFMFNLLGVYVGYCQPAERIVESSIYMNSIHLYDMDGTFAKTLCIGNQLTDIGQIEKGGIEGMQMQMYGLNVYDDCFAVLYNEMPKGQNAGQKSVLLFNIDGVPVARFRLDSDASAFDFDRKSGVLYTYDSQTEVMNAYDISSVVGGLN